MPGRAEETLHRDLLMGGAQLTIFYSGNVDVYEDVPAAKAHAIMLLLSNGKSSTISGSSNEYRPGAWMSKPAQVINTDEPTFNTNTVNSLGGGVQFRSSTSPCPSPQRITQVEKKQQQKLVIGRSQAELPFARKASLARFLEKRKDRVDAKLIKESSMAVNVNPGSPACKKIKL